MLEYWTDPVRCNNVDMSTLVHAHLIYLFKNYTYEGIQLLINFSTPYLAGLPLH